MRLLAAGLALLVHLGLIAGAAMFLPGLIAWWEARLAGQRGASPLAVWREIARFARKETVRERGGSALGRMAPAAQLAPLVAAALLVPSFAAPLPGAGLADLPAIVGLLALSRGTLALGALDSGLAVSGVAASGVIGAGALGDAGLFLVAFARAIGAGGFALPAIAAAAPPGAALAPLALALLLLGLIANERLPLGDGGAASEAAMGGQALALGYSGRHLALIRLGAALRLVIWFDLAVCLLLPSGLVAPQAAATFWAIALLAWAAKMALFALVLALAGRAAARLSRAGVRRAAGLAWVFALLAGLILIAARAPV